MSEGDYVPIRIEKETSDYLNVMTAKLHKERVMMEVQVNRFEKLVAEAGRLVDILKGAQHGK